MIVKNSSGKIIGKIDFQINNIIINNYKKPLLIINNEEHIKIIQNKEVNFMKKLYDEYYLTIGEIAALYNITYSKANKQLNQLLVTTKPQSGRRNSSFGQKFSEERKEKIGLTSRGRIIPQYVRTSEIKEKISSSLKKYFEENGVSESTRQKLSEAWARGCYDNVKMGRGIQGFMFSIKMKKDFYFRSLLELKYLLDIEIDDKIISYQVEPFQIKLNDNHHYTPDVLINNDTLIELKPFTHLNYESKERFDLEVSCAKEYCLLHNYNFQIIYDKDIQFRTSTFKTWIKNNLEIVELYNIRFNQNWS